MFELYVGIDYSGAQTPTSSLKGLRVFAADRDAAPAEVGPPLGARRYWTRRGVAEWLVGLLESSGQVAVGIDHAFSFPLSYFDAHRLQHDWQSFLDDFQAHWPTDGDHVYVQAVRDGDLGDAATRGGDARWRRLTETRARSAKSVFHFDCQGSVAKSSHAGIPWLRYLRQRLSTRVHVWPFDGWDVAEGRSMIAEVYPRLWSAGYPRHDRTPDQHDAFAVASWLRDADLSGRLRLHLHPDLTPSERHIAEVEGWILGVM